MQYHILVHLPPEAYVGASWSGNVGAGQEEAVESAVVVEGEAMAKSN